MKLVSAATLALLVSATLAPAAFSQTPTPRERGGGRMQFDGLPDSLRAQVRDKMMALPDDQRRALFVQLMQQPEDQRIPFLLRTLGIGAPAPASDGVPATTPPGGAPAPATPQGPDTRTGTQQGAILQGIVRDSSAQDVFPGATVKALRTRRPGQPASDTLAAGTVTNADGFYALRVPAGTYRVRYEAPGFRRLSRVVTVADGDVATFPAVSLEGAGGEAGEILVEGLGDVVRVSGDTTTFNAAAVRLAPGSTSEDLIRRVPGVTVENGQVNVRGERVTRVTVDGQEFFGNDALTTLQSLPADLIRDVQVLDQSSEQSRFSGFDDGNRERTINLVTRPDRRRGTFGRLSAGGSAEGRYIADGAVNLFRGTSRNGITFLTNNVNQQQFAFEDLAASGATEAFRIGGGGFGTGGPPMMRGGMNVRFGPGGFGLSTDGEATTHALGVTFSDRTAKGTTWNVSAMGNIGITHANSFTENRYASTSPSLSLATDSTVSRALARALRVQGRLETNLSPRTQLTLTGRVNGQADGNDDQGQSVTYGTNNAFLGRALNETDNVNNGYAGLATVLLRHRLARPGRTLSLNVAGGINGSDREQTLLSNVRSSTQAADSLTARRIGTLGASQSFSATLAYTEPLGENTQMQLSLSPSANWNESEQDARRLDYASLADLGPFPRYDNDVTQTVTRQRAGAQVQHRWGEGWRFTAGVDGQREAIESDQTLAGRIAPDPFLSVLPSATLAYQPRGVGMRAMAGMMGGGAPGGATGGAPTGPGRMRNGELSFRTSTNVPSVNQLGRVPDDSNPLRLSAGNAALEPSYTYELRGRAVDLDPITGAMNMVFGRVAYAQDFIATEQIIARTDTTIQGFRLARGGTFSRPINLDGQQTQMGMAMVARPVPGLPLTANLNVTLFRSLTPGRLNGAETETETRNLGSTLMLTTTRTRQWDASVSYNPSLSQTERTGVGSLAATSQSFVTHRATGMLRARPGKFIVETDVSLVGYTGEQTETNPTQVFWNAALGYSLGGTNPLELRLTAFDLLDQSNGFNRSFQTLFTQTRESNALGRYVMLRATYRFNTLGGARGGQQTMPGMAPGMPVIIRQGGGQ